MVFIKLNLKIYVKKTKVNIICCEYCKLFLSHRLPIAVAAKNAGYEVHVATAGDCDVSKIEAAGLKHHEISFKKVGKIFFLI